jgi:hypothetical protein
MASLDGWPYSLRPAKPAALKARFLAEEKGSWSAIRLHDVADRLSVPTPEILNHYRDLDAVADAWFLRGLKAMVGPKPADFLNCWHGSTPSLSTGE